MANIAGIYVVQQDDRIIIKREYKINTLILVNEQIKKLKDRCIQSLHSQVFKLPAEYVTKGEDIYSVCFIKRNDLFFIAVCIDNQAVGCEILGALQILRLLIEVTDETIGLDKMRENFYSLTLVLDTMLDYGYPLVTEKSILVNMLQKTDLLHKAQNAITGSVSDKHSNVLMTALSQINNNVNALWRYNQVELDQKGNENTTAFIKDVYVDYNEFAECIFNERGELEMQEISGEVLVETKIPGSKAKVSVKLRFNQDLQDFAIHKQCEGRNLQMIGNHEFSMASFIPPFGKFTLLKYIHKKFPLQLPFNLKANYNVVAGVCQFDCKFERFSLGKEKDGSTLWPQMEQIFVKFYFPEETVSASLTSLPEGVFNFDEKDKIGEWTLNHFTSPVEGHIKLSGNIKFNDNQLHEMPANIIAIVNLKIKEYTFSGSKIEKVSCNLSGGSTQKDDSSVFKGLKAASFAKNIEFRL